MNRTLMVALCLAVVVACRERGSGMAARSAGYMLLQEPVEQQAHRAQAGVAAAYVPAAPGLEWRAPAATAMLIRSAQAIVTVDSLEPAIASARALSDQLGGLMGDVRIETGQRQRRVAVLELRVPSDRFDEALSGLEPFGRVESVEVSAQDVGEEFVDVTARVENARRLERRLLDILAVKTARLRDVLEVEQALARVREEIERYEGRLRYLRAHVATSSITVTLQEPAPIVGLAGISVVGEAVKDAWRNFVGLIALVIAASGVVLPLALVTALGWWLVRRYRPRVVSATSAS